MKSRDLAIVRPEGKTDYQEELLEKSTQTAQFLWSEVQELYESLVNTNPLAAQLFLEQVLLPCSRLETTLTALSAIQREVTAKKLS